MIVAETIKKILFTVLILFLIAPAIQDILEVVPDVPLYGYAASHSKPDLKYFTWRRWFIGNFQQEFTAQVEDHIGFRNDLIRLRNQVDFSLFRQSNAPGFMVGKKDMFFEEDYIHEFTGAYFIGPDLWDKKINRLRSVYDSLKAHEVPLIIIIEPGKATFYPEYIPHRFHPEHRTQSNYEYFVQRSSDLAIPLLDLNRLFCLMKDTSRYPLFPKYGMHWSWYGMTKVLDTMIRYIEEHSGKDLPDVVISGVEFTAKSRATDDDIAGMFNLIWQPKRITLPYPDLYYDTTRSGKTASALVVADSYFVTLADSIANNIFRRWDYWYYNNKLFPWQNEDPPKYVDKTGLLEQYFAYDFILLMISEVNFHNAFWNFPDEAWLAFHPDSVENPVYRIENNILNDRTWFRFIVKGAKADQRPLWEAIHGNAAWVYNEYKQNP
jgi:hypothetical protein